MNSLKLLPKTAKIKIVKINSQDVALFVIIDDKIALNIRIDALACFYLD